MESKQGKEKKRTSRGRGKEKTRTNRERGKEKEIDEEIEKTSKKKMAEDIKLGEKTFRYVESVMGCSTLCSNVSRSLLE